MIRLQVPLEAQQKNSTCWHASALMLWRYSQGQTGRQGPMSSLVEKWANNHAIQPSEFIRLAGKVGLSALSECPATGDALENLLRTHGPIWCAGYWYGSGHVIVLTGVAGKDVFLNDPDGGVRKTGTVSWFIDKLASQYTDCMMVKNSY